MNGLSVSQLESSSGVRLGGRAVFLRLLQYAKPYSVPFMMSIILLTANLVFEVGLAWVQQLFIDTINGADMNALLHLIAICGAISFAIVICLMIQYYLRNYVQALTARDLSAGLFAATNRLSYRTVLSMHSGDLASRNNRDAGLANGMVSGIIYDLGYNLVLCAVAFVYLVRMNVGLSLLALGCGPIVFLAGRFFDGRLRRLSEQVQRQEAGVRALLQETLQGMKVVRAYGLEAELLERFIAEREKLNGMLRKQTILSGFVWQSSLLINGIVQVGCAGLIGMSAINGTMTPGQVLAFIIMMGRVQWPFVGMSRVWGSVQESLGASDRVFELLQMPSEDSPSAGPRSDSSCEGAPLSLRGVKFAHGSEEGQPRAVLFDGFDLEVAPGEVVAVVGPSGSGKSTLARLCCGLYEASEGIITVGGVPLTAEYLDEARSRITYVPQTPYLFAGTIRDNIALGAEGASEDEIAEAARLAGAAEFIDSMPDGYDTVIGEHGSSLSGGQRQRIAIARAFLRKSPLVILDEATSALDNESEQHVQRSIEHLAEERTILVIAHRLSTVRMATRIIVMDQGCIAEQGTHDELLARNGLYAHLYRIQFRDEPVTA